ncbi:hypothetical protein [Klebsiella oxytoca]|uniref:hypothetical protein n=1 Tax=Klebsiella oxytoca TaxID=571 RepID=UPI0029CAAC29|nr:hypothetical protein [Klebsiella oxytoca]WPI29410.1 hypothetical protein R8550_29080 [Klebsiella oxytoca]
MISYQGLVRTFPKKHGIDIVCVGYGIDKPLGFDGVYFKKINDISELNSLYKDLIRSLV